MPPGQKRVYDKNLSPHQCNRLVLNSRNRRQPGIRLQWLSARHDGSRGYDADVIREDMKKMKGHCRHTDMHKPESPNPCGRQHLCAATTSKRCINKMKNVRRLAIRYDKTAPSYPDSSRTYRAASGSSTSSTSHRFPSKAATISPPTASLAALNGSSCKCA